MWGRAWLATLMIFGAHLAWLAQRRGWKHIHVHSCADAANIALFSRLLGGPTYSITLHGPLSDYGPNQRQKWSYAAFGIVITRRLLDEIRRQLSGSLPIKLGIAPMGVDVSQAARRLPYTPWRSGPCRIFSCGRLNPVKGHVQLLGAVSTLVKRGWDVYLRIAGEDDMGGSGYRRVIQRMIGELGLQMRVTLMGAIPEASVFSELESSHIFCLASLHEPLGVAIMEAMAMQVPVVVIRAGGVPELVDHGIDGWMVSPNDPEELANGIEYLLRHPELATRFGRAARRKVVEHFSSEVSARTIATFVTQIQEVPPPVAPRSLGSEMDHGVI
jgi:colanic acid/amylovoran biosynthesis glycosyltransferase